MSAGYTPGSIRVWDGTSWVYQPTDWEEAPYEIIKTGATSTSVTSTTTCTRSPATIRRGQTVTVTASTSGRGGGNLEYYYRGVGGNWLLIATKAAPLAGGAVSITHAPGASGYYYAKFTGAVGHAPSSSASTALTTVQVLRTGSKSVNMGWNHAFNGSGDRISGTGRDSAVHQGFYSGTHGNRKTLIRFDPNLPAGAVVTSVIFLCDNSWSHWQQNAGGTIVLGWFFNTNTPPGDWPGGKVNPNKSRKPVSASFSSFSVDISSWACNALERADFSGITVGPGPSTSSEYYGYSKADPAGNDFRLMVEYNFWD